MQYNSLQEGTRMPRLKGSADLLEDRRRRALGLWDTGLSLNEVGRRIQCAPQFRPALAAGTAPRGTRRFAGALLAGTPAEVGGEATAPLGEGASEGAPGARLPDAVVDHGPHRRSHRARVRSALPSRSCRSAD